ncbi:MAG: peptidoglycan DD-metalloendopeptidase family protein [Porticoccaceae bacterium]|nr:peptidoglycan DD-metalloendopeptidase family protein [Porticoccaceae bacterium]
MNHDYKIPMTRVNKQRKKLHAPIMLGGTLILLAAIFYFQSTTSTISSELTKNTLNDSHTISIALPDYPSSDSNPHNKSNPDSTPISVADNSKAAGSQVTKNQQTWKEYTVKSGDSLASIFKKMKYSATTLHNIIHADSDAKLLKSLKPGQTLRFAQNLAGDCIAIEYAIDRIKTLAINSTTDGFSSTLIEKPVEIAHEAATSKINNSLFYDAKQAGLSDKTIMELANIFGWDIDFSQGLRQGDSFTLIYESKYIDGKRIENGNILVAEFINRGDKYQAVRFVNNDGDAEYFSPDGKSMRKTFLRNPIDFARISSRFNPRRKHPILNRIRAHKGVDYAASTGTPIKSTGDGKVVFRGTKGGYGRVVIVQHGQKYSSLYAHMSKYGRYKNGSRIKQGQVVGYVGKSGLATGPHLHYELRINGVHRNPLTAKFPAAKPIHKNLLAQFKQQTSPLLDQLQLAKQTQLALIN